MHKWADSKKIIKGLENDLTTFVDEVNRLTAIKKELEREMKQNVEMADSMIRERNERIKELEQELEDIKKTKWNLYQVHKLEQELERYKAFMTILKKLTKRGYGNKKVVSQHIKEFEEAKE